jgi:hypothetical protein
MESKLFGNDVDKKSHKELLIKFTNFLKHFTPLLDATEKYQQVTASICLFDQSEIAKEKYEVMNELCQTLTNLVPSLVKISLLEDRLEKLLDK